MTGAQGFVLHIAQAIKMGDCEPFLGIGEGVGNPVIEREVAL